MINNNIKSDLKQLRNRKRRVDWEDDAKSGGANIAPGSAEYREYVMDKQGLDEFEQEKVSLGRKGRRSQDNINPNKDVWHEQREIALAQEPVIKRKARVLSGNGVLSTAERKTSHQIRKMYLKDDVEALAVARARETESIADDKAVKRRLPKELDKQIYNDSIQDDDFYPGASVLNKYID